MADPVPLRPRRKRGPPPGGWPSWHDLLERDDRGRIIADLANVMIALRNDEAMSNTVIYDDMIRHSIVVRPFPAAPDAEPIAPVPHETGDDDISRLQEWLQAMGLRRVGREIVGQGVEMLAHEHAIHPVRDYLENLKWDGEPRLNNWLFRYLGAKTENFQDEDYILCIGRMFLISMIARVMRPGCQCDYMLVLEGPQGILKSSACRVLAGDYFADSLPDIHSKDAKQHVLSKWLIEVKELAAFTKADVEPLKAFIDRREEDFRPPYGKHNIKQPRQCVFIGTTNQDVYIKDPTGGRRFWPVVCQAIDLDALARDRDQLFAEAVVRFKAGERYWPTQAEEDQFFKPEQEKRQEEDPWFIAVRHGLIARNKTTVTQIAQEILGFEGHTKIGTAEQRRITNILRELKWTQKRDMHGRYYFPP